MEAYVMSKAGGTEKDLVLITRCAYESMTLQQIGNRVCNSCQVTMEQVNIDLNEISRIYLVDINGIHPISEGCY